MTLIQPIYISILSSVLYLATKIGAFPPINLLGRQPVALNPISVSFVFTYRVCDAQLTVLVETLLTRELPNE